ncbi:MAG: epoxyqueuosine reductase QueH [bacterium]|nr:epoxyqueuosine reductase QueH [bacterium]
MNYNLECEKILNSIDLNHKPTLLLHSCCAPCSSAVLERISKYFSITILFYNPNITDYEEYLKRKEELKRLIKDVNYQIEIMDCDYDKEKFIEMALGLEDKKEGDIRCYKCYKLRLEKTAIVAKENNFDYFTTTLSISPYKNSKWLNEIGEELANKYNINYLYADFKKKNGYKRSIELSNIYHLYRQDYCGCIYSKVERDKIKALQD